MIGFAFFRHHDYICRSLKAIAHATYNEIYIEMHLVSQYVFVVRVRMSL